MEYLSNINNQIDGPWTIMGDLNVIMKASEKKGGKLHRLNCMDECGMTDAGYSGTNITWTNGRKRKKKDLAEAG